MDESASLARIWYTRRGREHFHLERNFFACAMDRKLMNVKVTAT